MSNAKPALISLTDLNGEPFPIGGISLIPPRYKGNKFWRYRIYHTGLAGGRTEENTHKTTQAEAESLARQAYAIIANGCEEIPEGGSDTVEAMKFHVAAQIYLDNKGETVGNGIRYNLYRIIDEIGDMPVGKIDKQVMTRLWTALSVQSKGTKDGRMKADSANSAIFTPVLAVLNFHDISHKIKRPPVSKGRNRALDDTTKEAVLDYCLKNNPLLWRFLQIGFLTGMRQGEIRNLDWKDIDRNPGFISIWMPKKQHERNLPIQDNLRHILNQWPEAERHGQLFPNWNSRNTISRQLKKVEKGIGIKITAHQTRHTFGTNLVNGGASHSVIMKAGGWEDPRSMQRYVEPSDEMVAAALNKLPA